MAHIDAGARDCFWSIFEHEVREGAFHLEALERAARLTCEIYGIKSKKMKGVSGGEKKEPDSGSSGVSPDPNDQQGKASPESRRGDGRGDAPGVDEESRPE